MTHLVDDLLKVSRITQGKLALRKEVVALTDVWSGAVEASRFLLQSATRDLTLSIPTEHLNSVFDMFSQLAPALNRSQGGLGIGLSLFKALAALHGGSIATSRDGVGHGGTFALRMPILTTSTAIGDIAALALRDAKTLKILIVDDNEDAAVRLAMVLEISAHHVRTAYDGETGFARAETFGTDVTILDIGLPDITDYALAQRIGQTAWVKDTPLLALTGWGQYKDKQAAMRAGFNHHFTKPVDFDRLLQVIDLRGSVADS